MLRYIYADDLHRFPRLARSMFVDRATQFHDRLGWDVALRDDGTERDDYDDANPLYVIWEGTRLCRAPGAPAQVSAALMLGGMELGLNNHLSHSVGVFDARMVRIYARLGWGPTILGTTGQGRDATSVGLWAFEPELRPRLLARAGVSDEISRHWYDRSFGALTPASKPALSA